MDVKGQGLVLLDTGLRILSILFCEANARYRVSRFSSRLPSTSRGVPAAEIAEKLGVTPQAISEVYPRTC